jgi:D-alanyl-D-alanine carboxypeptidase/D-alanyl-D-alanine-endopeptidase (penicillin-binding protein 4)
VVQGGGDPKLVVERLQALLAQVQAGGARVVRGDIVLDRSAFSVPATDPGEFDGEPLRPYNARPDALLINFKSIVMTFTPDAAPAAGRWCATSRRWRACRWAPACRMVRVARCGDWRSELRASVENPVNIEFLGTYSSACGEKIWPSAYADPASFAARAIEGSWRQLGGLLTGTARDATPQELAKLRSTGTLSGEKAAIRFEHQSPTHAGSGARRQQVFEQRDGPACLPDAGPARQPGPAQSRHARRCPCRAGRLVEKKPAGHGSTPLMDNGSGLSRNERVTAAGLAALLLHAARSPLAADLADSLPVAGVDGTLRERGKGVVGQAFLKTGSLRDVTAIAGYANGNSGTRYIVVGLINHPNASGPRARRWTRCWNGP